MRTPAGSECPYFYGDYYRGRSTEECRLIDNNPSAGKWTRDLCSVCPVPKISRANACEFMILTPTIHKGILGVGKKVTVTAYCRKSESEVKVPEVGCGICHPLSNLSSNSRG